MEKGANKKMAVWHREKESVCECKNTHIHTHTHTGSAMESRAAVGGKKKKKKKVIHQQSLRFLGRLSKQVKKDWIFFSTLWSSDATFCTPSPPRITEEWVGWLVGRFFRYPLKLTQARRRTSLSWTHRLTV